MRRFYTALLWLGLPLVLARLLWRSRHAPAYRERWRERLGFYAGEPFPESLWIHAVSVGEVQAAQPLIKGLLERHPDLPLVVTTTTPTGAERLNRLFGAQVIHSYTPWDLPPVVRRFLDHTRPRLAVVMETEIWPNLFCTCKQRGIPVVLANARLSARSARGYARIGGLTREALGGIHTLAAQGEADARRFIELGADPARVQLSGNIKFDLHLPASLHEAAAVMRRLWGEGRPVWVAASTHEGEDEIMLEAQRRIAAAVPGALLVLVPRHPERFDPVAALVRREGFAMVRRSEDRPCTPETQVFLGDTMGEVPLFLAAADAAFIGGSLVPTGGHNLLEPAALGVPVAHGPHMFNFADITRLLHEADAAVEVDGADGLAALLSEWLADASERSRVGENGRRVVMQNRGALARLEEIVEETLRAAG